MLLEISKVNSAVDSFKNFILDEEASGPYLIVLIILMTIAIIYVMNKKDD